MVRAAVMREPNVPLEIQEFPEPQLEPGAILLDTLFSEVCGTDVHLHHGQLAGVPYPIIPGHINVGRVRSTAGEIKDVDGNWLTPGDVVTFMDVHETCNNCWFCLVAKATTRCPNRKVYGITYSANQGLLGGWSESIYLKPRVKVVKLPETVPPERFIGGGCGLPTALHAVQQAEIQLGDTVVVQGSGPVGLSAAILSALSGACQLIVIGAPRLRLDMALEMGADTVIDIEQHAAEERIAMVKDLTSGRGADVTIEASGNPRAIVEGMRMTRDQGRYVVVGQYTDAGDVTINPHWDINRKHLEIRGTWGIDFSHFYRSVKVMAKYGHRYPWERLITRSYGLDEVNQALADVADLKVIKAVIKPQG
jgi:threonine dehydrogenase-like Zn-dependent dehydrogenase